MEEILNSLVGKKIVSVESRIAEDEGDEYTDHIILSFDDGTNIKIESLVWDYGDASGITVS